MPEEEHNDGFYWEPDPGAPLRQGDLLLNVPVALMPSHPEFVIRGDGPAEFHKASAFPEVAPSDEVVVEARFGVLTMIVTPTCHISDDEKDEDVVAIVPVEPLARAVDSDKTREQIRNGQSPYHLFFLQATKLGGGILPFDAVAQLDRPGSLLKHDLPAYRRLGLFRDARFELRKQLAWFWARTDADNHLSVELDTKIKHNVPLESIE